jgi:orotidine-5'-phosphate decarboxylase
MHQFFENTDQLGFDLLKAVKAFVIGYEPQRLPMWLWERAIMKGYAAFRELKEAKRVIVIVDMKERDLRFEPLLER